MSTSRSSKNDSSTSENESMSDNEVSCEESVVIEQTRKTRASSSQNQQHSRHTQHQARHTYYHQQNKMQSHSKQFAKNFIVDQQTVVHNNRQQPSVRYYISPSSTDARAISANGQLPLRNPNLAPGYYQIKDGANILPSVQACGPQYVYDNYAYKPGFSYMPTYSTGGMHPSIQQQQHHYGLYPANRLQASSEMKCLPMHRSSEHLDSMGATITTSAGSEFVSIKYVQPMGQAGSRLVKGEAPSICPMPNGGRMMPSPGGQTYSSPAIHFMPSGSQHSLNFNAPNYNPYAQNSYRMINYDLIHQQQLMQQQIAMQEQQSQPETDTTGEEESDAASTPSRASSKERKEKPQAVTATCETTSTPIRATKNKTEKNKSSITTTRISKPASTNWILTGGARNILSGNSQVRNFLRSNNGYYDDSVNERVILGGVDKQNTKFKRYCKICGITGVISFVVIALVLGSVLGVMFNNKSKIYFEFNFNITK
jgi:hypothetical protein